MDALNQTVLATRDNSIVPRSLSKAQSFYLILVATPFLIGIVFWVCERRIQPKLAVEVQTLELYWLLSGPASGTDLGIRPRAHVISETLC